jgi:hypothetical protein
MAKSDAHQVEKVCNIIPNDCGGDQGAVVRIQLYVITLSNLFQEQNRKRHSPFSH